MTTPDRACDCPEMVCVHELPTNQRYARVLVTLDFSDEDGLSPDDVQNTWDDAEHVLLTTPKGWLIATPPNRIEFTEWLTPEDAP